jgi:hypothetical protein
MKRNKILIVALVLLIIGGFTIWNSNKENPWDETTFDLLENIFSSTYTEGEKIYGQSTDPNAMVSSFEELLDEKFKPYLTERNFTRLAANRVAGSAQKMAYKYESDFAVSKIQFIKTEERLGKDFSLYKLYITETDRSSGDEKQKYEIEVYVNLIQESGKYLVDHLELMESELKTRLEI